MFCLLQNPLETATEKSNFRKHQCADAEVICVDIFDEKRPVLNHPFNKAAILIIHSYRVNFDKMNTIGIERV